MRPITMSMQSDCGLKGATENLDERAYLAKTDRHSGAVGFSLDGKEGYMIHPHWADEWTLFGHQINL